jgi:hypothetical protein
MKIKKISANLVAITHDNRTWYFSYETCIAYEDELVCIRLDKYFSSSTKKHINQTDIKNFTPVSDIEFHYHAA